MNKLIYVLIFMLSYKAFAQNPVFIPSGKERCKQVAGRYGSSSGICLFDDGKFLLYGYATMVFGSYGFEKDHLNFYPDKQERFVVFATKHSEIGKNVRMYFQGFEDGSTFVQFDTDSVQRVFNEGANCFNNPYVYTSENTPTSITLFEKPSDDNWYQHVEPNVWKFKVEKDYNSFMLIHNEPGRERQDFTAMIELVDGAKVLKLSNYGGNEGYMGSQQTEEDNNWKEILEMKRQYYSAFEHRDTLYANNDYNIFNIHDNDNYRYEKDSDRYVDIYNKDNDSYYQGDTYNDSRFLKKYVRVRPVSKDTIAFDSKIPLSKPLFFTQCDGETIAVDTLESQGDIGLNIPIMTDNSSEVITAEILPIDTTRIVERPNYATFQPFYVNLDNGFYEVIHANYADYNKTIFEKKPALSKADIEDVKMEIDERGIPIANVNFKTDSYKKLEAFTRKNIDNPIAIVVNKKVIMMPVVLSLITGGKVSISGGCTVEEIQEIVEHLNKK